MWRIELLSSLVINLIGIPYIPFKNQASKAFLVPIDEFCFIGGGDCVSILLAGAYSAGSQG